MVYWSIALALGVLGLAYVVLARRWQWPMPPRSAPGWSRWSALLPVIVWPLVIAFVTAAVASLAGHRFPGAARVAGGLFSMVALLAWGRLLDQGE